MQPLAALALGMLAFGTAQAQSAEPSPEDEFVPWTDPTGERRPSEAAPPVPAPTAERPAEASREQDSQWGAVPAPLPSVTPPPIIDRPPVPPRRVPSYRPSGPPPSPGVSESNHVSIYGASTLGTLNRGLGVYLGFPLVGLRAAVGASPRLDVGVGFDSFYGSMNDVRLVAKYLLRGNRAWAVAVAVEGGVAFFAQRPEAEGHGPRWLTGRRNYNAEIGLITSYQGPSPQSARLFVDARYHLGIDTQPYAQDPLGGVPPQIQLGHNVPIRMGAEMPFSPSASFLFLFGFEVHGREIDSRFMPLLAVGLVSGI